MYTKIVTRYFKLLAFYKVLSWRELKFFLIGTHIQKLIIIYKSQVII